VRSAGRWAAAALAVSVVSTPAAGASAGDAYGELLARHVRQGTLDGITLHLVDYAALARDPSYRKALADLAATDPDRLASDAKRFAFWINAYNLLALKTVVDLYPVDSIKDGGNFLFPIWTKPAGEAGRRKVSLDEVEHGILRKQFHDPRVHVAIVCASVSCPDLRPEPYEAARLDAQLDDQATRFLANPSKGMRLAPDGRTAEVSSIFKWFAEDFAARGGVAKFLRDHAPPELRARMSGLDDGGLGYLDYDWSLNDSRRAESK
jgi:hypothetical protein